MSLNKNYLSYKESYQSLPNELKGSSNSIHLINRLKDILSPLKGYFFSFLAAFSWSCSNIFIKKAYILTDFDQLTILNLITIISMLPIIFYNKLNLFGIKDQRILLSFRGILSVIGLIFLYLSLRFIPPSDLSACGHISMLVTALLSRIFLKEKLGIPHIFALCLTVAGIYIFIYIF